MKALLNDVRLYWYIQAHNNQSTERGVQETSICCQNGKGESDASTLVMLRSDHLAPVFRKIRSEQGTKVKKANQHMSAGKDGERELRSESAKRNHAKREKNGTAERARVLPIKETSRAHIIHAMSSCISDEDLKLVKSVLKQKSIGQSSDGDDDEQEPKKKNAKEMRHSQFAKMISNF